MLRRQQAKPMTDTTARIARWHVVLASQRYHSALKRKDTRAQHTTLKALQAAKHRLMAVEMGHG